MSNERLVIDANDKNGAGAITDNALQEIRNLRIDDLTKGLKVMMVGGAGGGTVTSISQSTGILLTPNPIIATGTVGLATNIAPIATLGTAGQQIRVNAGATALEYFTFAGAGVAIGDTITGGTDGSVLFINPVNVLAQDNANFNFNNTLNRLNVAQMAITGTAGAGFLTFVNQSVQPTPPPSGTLLLHAFTTPFTTLTRLEVDNENPTNLTVGRDSRFEAINNTGSTITKGQVVNIDTGVANDIPSIVLADDGSLTKFPVAGFAQDDILSGAIGYVLIIGILKDIDGQGFTPGFPLYLHPTTPGAVTTTRPVSPSLTQPIGYVMDGGNPTGSFFVHVATFVGGLESGTTSFLWKGQTMQLQSPSALTLGLASTNAGAILFKNATNANTLTLQSGVTSAPYTLTLPTTQGGASTFLQNNGSGVLSWAAAGTGSVTAIGVTTANGVSGTSSGGATPNLTITLGAITPTTVNGNTFTTGSSTFTGTAAQTYTFPTTTATLARTDAAQTFTGIQTFSTPIAPTSVQVMTATVGGGVPTPPNNTTTFLRGDGTFAAPNAAATTSVTMIPLGVSGNSGGALGSVGNGGQVTGNTTMFLGQVVIPFKITANQISINVSSTPSLAGTIDITMYSEDGQTQIFSVTTATISSSGVKTVALSAVVINPGVYYIAVNSNGTAVIDGVNGWAAQFTDTALGGAVTSKPKTEGKLTITAGTPPATINPTAIVAQINETLAFRLDN